MTRRMSPDRAKDDARHTAVRATQIAERVDRVFDWAFELRKSAFPAQTAGGGVTTSTISDPTSSAALHPDHVDRLIQDLFTKLELMRPTVDAAWEAMVALTPLTQDAAARLRKLGTEADDRGGAKRYCAVCDKPAGRLRGGKCDPCYSSFRAANPITSVEVDAWRKRRREFLRTLDV